MSVTYGSDLEQAPGTPPGAPGPPDVDSKVALTSLWGRSRPLRTVTGVLRAFVFGALPVAVIATLIIFVLTSLSSANPAAQALGQTATPKAIARLDAAWGLNQPLFTRYFSWLGHALQGDLGKSWFDGTSVMSAIAQRLPVDISVAVVALLIALLVGVPAGIVAGTRPGGKSDRLVTFLASIAITVPVFWIGILLTIVFAVKLKWLPATGYTPPDQGLWQWFEHLILPGLTLSLLLAGMIARQLRTSIAAAMRENYVVGATVRGLSSRRILGVHVLRNAAAPTVAAIGLEIPQLLGGAVITETVFALPGIGQYALEGAQNHDVPVIQGVLLIMVVTVLISNLAVDLLLAWMRPGTKRAAR